jgi:hypothetical protein
MLTTREGRMVPHDFNRELDHYIDKRRKIMGETPYTQQTIEKEEEDLKVAEEQMEEIEDEDMQEIEEVPQQKKPSFFARLFQRVSTSKEEVEIEEGIEVVEVSHEKVDEDVRLVLKLSYQWLSYLPKSKLDQFKESQDFETYKDVLKKYGLIK